MSKQGRIADLYAAYEFTCKRLKEEEDNELANGHVVDDLILRKTTLESMLEMAIRVEYGNLFINNEYEDTGGC